MKWVYKTIRTMIVTLLVLVFAVPAALYVALSLPSVQNAIRTAAERELSDLLTTDVSIEHISITPFNRIMLYGVSVDDGFGATALSVRKLGAGINFFSFLFKDRVELTYAELIGLKADIYRDTPESPLNIQSVIDALSSKDKNKPPSRFDFRINTVVLRTSAVSYNVRSVQCAVDGRFDANHLDVYAVNADIQLPAIKNDDFSVVLRRFALKERSGFEVENLSGDFHVSDSAASVRGLTLKLPSTRVTFADMDFSYPSFEALKTDLSDMPVSIAMLPGSYVNPSDMAAFLPVLKQLDIPLDIELDINGEISDLRVRNLSVRSSDMLDFHASGYVRDVTVPSDMTFDFKGVEARFNGVKLNPLLAGLTYVSEAGAVMLSNLGMARIRSDVSGSLADGSVKSVLMSTPGNVNIDMEYSRTGAGALHFAGSSVLEGFSGYDLFAGIPNALSAIGYVDARVDCDGELRDGKVSGSAGVEIQRIVYRDREYHDITAHIDARAGEYAASVSVANPGLDIDAVASADVAGKDKSLALNIDARDIDLKALTGKGRFDTLSLKADIDLSGRDADHVEGHVNVSDFSLHGIDGKSMDIRHARIDSRRLGEDTEVTLQSDVADGRITGRYHSATLAKVCGSLMADLLPGLTGTEPISPDDRFWKSEKSVNELAFGVTVKDISPFEAVAKMPVRVIYPVELSGALSSKQRTLSVDVSAPFLQQGNKLIEGTALKVDINGVSDMNPQGYGHLSFNTVMPTKKGPMTLHTSAYALNDRIDTRVDFKVARERNFGGELNLSAQFSHDEDRKLRTELFVNPGQLVFNDTVWNVASSKVTVAGKDITVEDFNIGRPGQYVAIAGRSTSADSDSIAVTLRDVNLDYVFETLDISNVTFGGNATGMLYAKQVLTPMPVAYTPGLDVRRLSYNGSLLGDAVIESRWVAPRKTVALDVTINQADGRTSYVNGRIMPAVDSLDLRFETDRIPIGFIKPFMSAFATDVSGYATGNARLWGTFKLVDMVGMLYGEDIKLTLGFTNTSYTTTDTVLFTPGRISIDDFTLHDAYGHTAKLNGWLAHKYFKEPSFNFSITDASDFLVYDVKEQKDQAWYGRLFGNGSVNINGEPGIVNIGADMSTAPGSAFTFVLSDALNAQNYNFITFRDRNQAYKDSIAAINAPPAIVRELKERMASASDDGPPSVYSMNFAIDVNPQALMTLVMDPVAGDRIKAYGRGNMRLAYDSRNEDLWLNGTYTVERGSYNFTLQDIIIKEFNITDGSSIAFHGDPYSAQLDINATYALNANLTDLDESFSADKDLNRTNVPVQAVLKVNGDMRQPEIGYDLNFPTLSQDVYRKVRSIVNTEEMMNRQIIYLLALNRFYTPDYMQATRGNELVSVASSTISSQLGSMLGQLSDNWVISPNFRSDRGDFSDVEVDLALSSHLLNNRLLLNGNFGYRDKTLNNNSFIGDFDIEYLLNRSGTIRLKAYNRYNDQNYYVKSALTTQGVGIVFKRDFDSFLSFLRPWLRKRQKSRESGSSQPDSVSVGR